MFRKKGTNQIKEPSKSGANNEIEKFVNDSNLSNNTIVKKLTLLPWEITITPRQQIYSLKIGDNNIEYELFEKGTQNNN